MTSNFVTRAISRAVLPALRVELGRALYMERVLPSLAKDAQQSRHNGWRDPNTTALINDIAAHAGVTLREVVCPYAETCATDLRHTRLSSGIEGETACLAAVFNQAIAARNGRLDAILAIAKRFYADHEIPLLERRVDQAKVSARYATWLKNRLGWAA